MVNFDINAYSLFITNNNQWSIFSKQRTEFLRKRRKWKIDREKNKRRDRERGIKRERGKKRGSQAKLKKSDDPTNIDNNNSNMRELIMKITKYSCLNILI